MLNCEPLSQENLSWVPWLHWAREGLHGVSGAPANICGMNAWMNTPWWFSLKHSDMGREKKVVRERESTLGIDRETWREKSQEIKIVYLSLIAILSPDTMSAFDGTSRLLGISEDHRSLTKRPCGLMPSSSLQIGKLRSVKGKRCYSYHIPK